MTWKYQKPTMCRGWSLGTLLVSATSPRHEMEPKRIWRSTEIGGETKSALVWATDQRWSSAATSRRCSAASAGGRSRWKSNASRISVGMSSPPLTPCTWSYSVSSCRSRVDQSPGSIEYGGRSSQPHRDGEHSERHSEEEGGGIIARRRRPSSRGRATVGRTDSRRKRARVGDGRLTAKACSCGRRATHDPKERLIGILIPRYLWRLQVCTVGLPVRTTLQRASASFEIVYVHECKSTGRSIAQSMDSMSME